MLALLVQARHEDASPMSNAEIRDELVTMLVAGHETTAHTLSWAVERLRRHPDVAGAPRARRPTKAARRCARRPSARSSARGR